MFFIASRNNLRDYLLPPSIPQSSSFGTRFSRCALWKLPKPSHISLLNIRARSPQRSFCVRCTQRTVRSFYNGQGHAAAQHKANSSSKMQNWLHSTKRFCVGGHRNLNFCMRLIFIPNCCAAEFKDSSQLSQESQLDGRFRIYSFVNETPKSANCWQFFSSHRGVPRAKPRGPSWEESTKSNNMQIEP